MTTDPQDSLQQLLGDMLRNNGSFEDFLESQRTSFINLELIRNIIQTLVIGLIIGAYITKAYRIMIPSLITGNKPHRLTYRAVLDRLSAIGVHRRFGESRERFASRASDVAPSIIGLTESHLSYALGDGHAEKSRPSNWQELNEMIQREIISNIKPRRRFIGLVNPFSWLLTK
jgi:hypothetical protein